MLRAAIALADDSGIEALSMRGSQGPRGRGDVALQPRGKQGRSRRRHGRSRRARDRAPVRRRTGRRRSGAAPSRRTTRSCATRGRAASSCRREACASRRTRGFATWSGCSAGSAKPASHPSSPTVDTTRSTATSSASRCGTWAIRPPETTSPAAVTPKTSSPSSSLGSGPAATRCSAEHAEQHVSAPWRETLREFEFGLDLILDGLKKAL